MIKKQRSKEMSGEEPVSKNKEVENEVPRETVIRSKCLRALRECEMPGVGAFKSGDIITDPEKIQRIADNPNFEVINQEEKS